MQQALDVLKQYDALIKHQYSGSSEAMTDLQHATWGGYDVIAALEQELAKAVNKFKPDWDQIKPYHDRIAELEAQIALYKKADNARELGLDYEPEQEPVAWMRMPKEGDRVVCIEDESLGTVESLTGGGAPDIKFDDGSHGTYLLREFAELFRYADTAPPKPEQEPVAKVVLTEIIGLPLLHWLDLDRQFDFKGGEFLYTAPPSKQWVGLTDADIANVWDELKDAICLDHKTFACAIEAKLREKNG